MRPLFEFQLQDLGAVRDGWEACIPIDFPEVRVETLLHVLGWGTYHLNTPGGIFPEEDPAFRAAFVHRQWEAWGKAAALSQLGRQPHDAPAHPAVLEVHWKQDRERRMAQDSVLNFTEELCGAAGLLLRALPAPLEEWMASGRWARWMAELRRRVEATDEVGPAERQARKRLIEELDWWVEPARVEIGYARDNVSNTYFLRFRRVGSDVQVSWHPPDEPDDDSWRSWLPQTGQLILPADEFHAQVRAFRDAVRLEMEARLLTLAGQGAVTFSEAAPGKHILNRDLGPVEVAAPLEPAAVLARVRWMEATFGVRVEDC
ncbi:DUF5984 family protein [Deinococcus radiotolerans]|uniref:Uncharacterized protein n=1 Tax=Deinococcus radiotolerans TaxID=1309407 RepID=A0ABQ2FKD9_9DEIO|nr:DUF5984 family protein [Deinococcus radiotolerans]GGK98357.1 hypothetical protein GCM10010844_15720 [Deinococcus radiotolerans]